MKLRWHEVQGSYGYLLLTFRNERMLPIPIGISIDTSEFHGIHGWGIYFGFGFGSIIYQNSYLNWDIDSISNHFEIGVIPQIRHNYDLLRWRFQYVKETKIKSMHEIIENANT